MKEIQFYFFYILVLPASLSAHEHQGQCFGPALATSKQQQFLPEDSTLGDFAGLSPAGVSSADAKALASEQGERFGLA